MTIEIVAPDLIQVVVEQPTGVTVVTVAEQGPPGIPGEPGPPGEAALEGEATGDIDMAGFDLLGAAVVGFVGEVDNGLSGTAKTIYLAAGNKQKIVVNADTVLTIDATDAQVTHTQLRIIQDAVGGHDVAFAGISSSRWLGSPSAPAVNAAPNGESILAVFFDGANTIQSLAKVGAA